VLYLPAGTYRLTSTVRTVRQAHTDCQGVAVIGEHPERTVLRWDGPDGGTMFAWDAWYSKISRLAFDGAGKADVGLVYGPAFSTYNETSDLWLSGRAAVSVRRLRGRRPDSQLELDGHLGLALQVRGLRARHP
jgi:hypothetical protein